VTTAATGFRDGARGTPITFRIVFYDATPTVEPALADIR
jgi:hypothetical protein